MNVSVELPSTRQFDVGKKTFSKRAGAYILAVLINKSNLRILRAWLIPMAELTQVAHTGTGKYILAPSPKSTSQDKYTRYLCTDIGEVVAILCEHLDNSGVRT